MLRLAVMALTLWLDATTRPDDEATSLLGQALVRPDIAADRLGKLQTDLDQAKANLEAHPESEDAAIWFGRRLAYLGRYRDAINAFTTAIEKHPRSYRLLRHRGHRYITIRKFDEAIADLSRAAELMQGVPDELEPDGQPNAKNIPRSTDHSNVWYHLALAHYLKGDFAKAADCWQKSVHLPRVNADIKVSSGYWLYLSLRRCGEHARANRVLDSIGFKMPVIENHAYHRLLLMFKGSIAPGEVRESAGDDAIADATVGYGIAVLKLLNGNEQAAREGFAKVLKTENWAAFGFIAAEAEVARMR
jgi:tetratricopeptide (TPR) repeat protein